MQTRCQYRRQQLPRPLREREEVPDKQRGRRPAEEQEYPGAAVPGWTGGASGRPEMAADLCQRRQQQHQRCQVDQAAGLHRHMSCVRAFSPFTPSAFSPSLDK